MTTEQLAFGDGPLERMTLWSPEGRRAAGTLFVVHGLTEYIGRYEELARYMTGQGWAVAGFNIPGHGGALLTADGAPRPAWCGGEGSWQTVTGMLDRALRRVRARAPGRPVALLGFSLGSFLVRAWLTQQREPLPRVRAVLGFLRGVQPESLLDVGSGRGAFLFPFLEAFPATPVTALDLLPHRVELLRRLAGGGIDSLTAQEADLCRWDGGGRRYDVVTLLEVLEHIPDVEAAVRAAVALARRYVVVSVPSKPDNNPEHIHLLTRDRLTQLFARAGCERLHFGGVNGHLLLTVTVEEAIPCTKLP